MVPNNPAYGCLLKTQVSKGAEKEDETRRINIGERALIEGRAFLEIADHQVIYRISMPECKRSIIVDFKVYFFSKKRPEDAMIYIVEKGKSHDE